MFCEEHEGQLNRLADCATGCFWRLPGECSRGTVGMKDERGGCRLDRGGIKGAVPGDNQTGNLRGSTGCSMGFILGLSKDLIEMAHRGSIWLT